MKNFKFLLLSVYLFLGLFLAACKSVDHTDTVQEREEHLKNSYPACLQWNTCTNNNSGYYGGGVSSGQGQNNSQ